MCKKICNKCKEEKEANSENFRICKYSNGKEYLKSFCKSCETKNSAAYNKTHKLSQERKEKFKIYKKQWKIENREIINKKYKERCKNDISFRLRKNVSRAVHRMIASNGCIKNASILKFLPYSINELKSHIELLFDEKMSWHNYGIYWEIDHIIPQSDLPYFNMTDKNFITCWNLSNLRPLEALQNRSDGATRIRHKKV